jgi:hypothetical protein
MNNMAVIRWIGIVILTVSLGSACREDRSVAGRAPAPTDSLYRLYRQLLVDPNPHAVQQAILCEDARLLSAFGPKAGNDSLDVTEKRAYGWRDRRRVNEALDRLRGHVFTLDEPTCGKFALVPRK